MFYLEVKVFWKVSLLNEIEPAIAELKLGLRLGLSISIFICYTLYPRYWIYAIHI